MCQAMSSSHCYSGLFMCHIYYAHWPYRILPPRFGTLRARALATVPLQQQQQQHWTNLLHVVLHQNDHVEVKKKKNEQKMASSVPTRLRDIPACAPNGVIVSFVMDLVFVLRQNNILIFNHRSVRLWRWTLSLSLSLSPPSSHITDVQRRQESKKEKKKPTPKQLIANMNGEQKREKEKKNRCQSATRRAMEIHEKSWCRESVEFAPANIFSIFRVHYVLVHIHCGFGPIDTNVLANYIFSLKFEIGINNNITRVKWITSSTHGTARK